MTASITPYRNVQIVSPTPTGNAGQALNNNFVALSDQTAGLTTSVASTNTALTTHAALTAAHGTTGNIVGTSDTQTLTNKNITDATNNISASVLTSGTVSTARLGSGTASSTTFLRGDQTWSSLPTATVSSVTIGNGLSLSGGVLSFSGAGYDAAGSAAAAQAASLPLNGGTLTGNLNLGAHTITNSPTLATVKGVALDNSGSVLPSGAIASTYIPANYTITGWNVISQDGTSGSITFDVFTVATGSYVPNSVSGLTSIVGTGHTYPSLSSAAVAVNGSVNNWTSTQLTGGYYLIFEITSVSSIKTVRIELELSPR